MARDQLNRFLGLEELVRSHRNVAAHWPLQIRSMQTRMFDPPHHGFEVGSMECAYLLGAG
jgi:hypothetical protein